VKAKDEMMMQINVTKTALWGMVNVQQMEHVCAALEDYGLKPVAGDFVR
jgi:hypothetical protein